MLAFNELKTRDEAAATLARRIGERLRMAVYRRAVASMILNGGTSPLGLLHTLRLLPLPWCLVTIVPSDERWVPVDDAESNEGMMPRDELDAAWQWLDPIHAAWEQHDVKPRPYIAGTWGPAASSALISRDGLAWSEEL